jgi:hypothetical protein
VASSDCASARVAALEVLGHLVELGLVLTDPHAAFGLAAATSQWEVDSLCHLLHGRRRAPVERIDHARSIAAEYPGEPLIRWAEKATVV